MRTPRAHEFFKSSKQTTLPFLPWCGLSSSVPCSPLRFFVSPHCSGLLQPCPTSLSFLCWTEVVARVGSWSRTGCIVCKLEGSPCPEIQSPPEYSQWPPLQLGKLDGVPKQHSDEALAPPLQGCRHWQVLPWGPHTLKLQPLEPLLTPLSCGAKLPDPLTPGRPQAIPPRPH